MGGPPFQDSLERGESTVLQRLNGTDRLADHFGNLHRTQVLKEAKDQDLLLLFG
jgi:hypothetical protein